MDYDEKEGTDPQNALWKLELATRGKDIKVLGVWGNAGATDSDGEDQWFRRRRNEGYN